MKNNRKIIKIQWWRYHFADFYDIDLNLKINQYLDLLEKIIKNQFPTIIQINFILEIF